MDRLKRVIAVLAVPGVLACLSSHRTALVVGVPASVGDRAPNQAGDVTTASVLGNIYETLVDVDPRLGLTPGLAESWYTPDDLTWVFKLRAGVRTHEGGTLSASDVVRSLENARDDPASAHRAALREVRAVEATDPLTVVLRMRRPVDSMPARLARVFVWSPPARGGPAVGTGRYRVRSWQSGGDAVLEAFAAHRDGRPPISQVSFQAFPDASRATSRLLGGQLDVVVDPPAEQLMRLRDNPALRAVSLRGLHLLLLSFDSTRASTPYVAGGGNPFRDRRVRQAVALAIDRRALVQATFHGLAEVADQIASPDELGGLTAGVGARPHDPEGALRLLKEAGYARGFAVRLDHAASPRLAAVAAAVAADLGRIGVRVEPRSAPDAELDGRIERRDTSFYLIDWSSGVGDARESYAALLHSATGPLGRENGGGYASRPMDLLIEASYGSEPPERRRSLYARLAAKVALDVPVVPLVRLDDSYVVASGLEFSPRLDRLIRVADIRWTEDRRPVP